MPRAGPVQRVVIAATRDGVSSRALGSSSTLTPCSGIPRGRPWVEKPCEPSASSTPRNAGCPEARNAARASCEGSRPKNQPLGTRPAQRDRGEREIARNPAAAAQLQAAGRRPRTHHERERAGHVGEERVDARAALVRIGRRSTRGSRCRSRRWRRRVVDPQQRSPSRRRRGVADAPRCGSAATPCSGKRGSARDR
jgi:hypothetical protein